MKVEARISGIVPALVVFSFFCSFIQPDFPQILPDKNYWPTILVKVVFWLLITTFGAYMAASCVKVKIEKVEENSKT